MFKLFGKRIDVVSMLFGVGGMFLLLVLPWVSNFTIKLVTSVRDMISNIFNKK